MDTAAVSSLQRQVLIWNYFETYEADRVRETLRTLPSTFSGPQASDRQSVSGPVNQLQGVTV